MAVYDLYNLIGGSYTSGGTFTVCTTPSPCATPPQPLVAPNALPAPGAVPANLNVDNLTPGTYWLTYQAPATGGCSAPAPIVGLALTIKDKPIVTTSTGILRYCPRNGAALTGQNLVGAATNNYAPYSTWNEGTFPLNWTWKNNTTTIGTGKTLNYAPPGPYASEQVLTNINVTAATVSIPVCMSTAAHATLYVSPNINDGMASNTIFCQGSTTNYNVNTSNIMGATAPTGSSGASKIRREIMFTGTATIPKSTGGTLTSGTWYDYVEFNSLVLTSFTAPLVLTFTYRMFYTFADSVDGCMVTSSPFTVTIQTVGSSGSSMPQTVCNG